MPGLRSRDPAFIMRCTRCWASSRTAPQLASPVALSIRQASTRAKASAAVAGRAEVTVLPRRLLGTKSIATTATAAKRPRSRAEPAVALVERTAPEPAKTKRAASTKSTPSRKATSASNRATGTAKTTQARKVAAVAAVTPTSTSSTAPESQIQYAAAATAPAPASPPRPRPLVAASLSTPTTAQPKPIDPSSPEYKRASLKYTALLVALPILLVTSYFLFDRLALGHPQKSLRPEKPPASMEAKDEKASS